MSKLIKGSIDVTKIKKAHIFKGKKGSYINVDIWINDKTDEYDNDAGIKQSYKVGDEYESHYIGNGKKGVGWDKDDSPTKDADVVDNSKEEDDLPF